MRLIQNVVRILDSQPSLLKPRTRGQSLVELTVTAPLLFLMVVSMAEIGFAANNYLILLDAVRIGARYAVSADPLTWNDAETRSYLRTACYYQTAWDPTTPPHQSWHLTGYYDTTFNAQPHNGKAFPNAGSQPQAFLGYKLPTDPKLWPAPNAPKGLFDGVTCNTIASMEPLNFDTNYYPPGENVPGQTYNSNANYDDIAVSVVSYVVADGVVHITGRWPVSNRLCLTAVTGDGQDPFSYNGNAAPQSSYPTGHVRGFIVTGNMLATDSAGNVDSNCYGSSFTVGGSDPNRDLVAILNSTTQLTDPLMQKNMLNGAMVIVEATWTHHQLFGFPPMSFLGNPTLYVWSVFPVTAAEPTPTPAPSQLPGPFSLVPVHRGG